MLSLGWSWYQHTLSSKFSDKCHTDFKRTLAAAMQGKWDMQQQQGYSAFLGRLACWRAAQQRCTQQTRHQLERGIRVRVRVTGPQHQTHSASSTLTGFEVGLWVEHDLRGPVPPRGNILRECSLMVMSGVRYPGQTKVTDLQRSDGRDTQLYRGVMGGIHNCTEE